MRRGALLIMIAGLLGACSDEAPRAAPGTLSASVVGPNGPEGAAVLILLGEGIESLSPLGPTELHVGGADPTRLVLIHPTGGELMFEVSVADTTVSPAWVVEQVAGPDDELRTDLAEYSVEFRR